MSDNVTDPNLNRNEHDDTGGVTAKRVKNYVWNSNTLAWDKETQPGGGGSGGTVNQSNTIDATPVTQNITAQDVGSTTVTTNANNQAVTTGSPTAGSVASFALTGYDSARIQVTGGSWTGTLVAQISLDGGITWYNQGVHESGTAYTQSSFTANFSGHTNAAGGTNWRLQSTTAWTGTATVRVVASVNPSSIYVANNPKLADGMVPSVTATVKAASTAPLATDTALVVSQSPNSPGTKTTDGTNNVNVLKSDGTAAGQNAELVSGTGMTTGTLTLNSGSPATAWFDMLNYAWVSVEILTNTTPATLTWQSSGDAAQTNITSMGMNLASNTSLGGLVTTASTNGTFHGPRSGRYFRVNSNNGAGTTTLVITFFTNASAFFSSPTAVGSNSATGSAVPANAFYLGINTSGNLSGVSSASAANDAATAITALQTGVYVYNGTSFDRLRSATAASGTTGTGLLGVGMLGFDGTNFQYFRSVNGAADGVSTPIAQGNYLYNNTNFDRQRSNTTGVVIAAGATASNAGVSVTTYNASKALINTNIASGAGTVVVAINGVTASGYVYNILTSAAMTGAGNNQQRIFPGATAATGLVANDLVPRTLQIVTTVVGTISYGIDYELSV